jgi:hypothetical protein
LFAFTHYPAQNRFALLARKCYKTLIAIVIFHFGHKQPQLLNITGG